MPACVLLLTPSPSAHTSGYADQSTMVSQDRVLNCFATSGLVAREVRPEPRNQTMGPRQMQPKMSMGHTAMGLVVTTPANPASTMSTSHTMRKRISGSEMPASKHRSRSRRGVVTSQSAYRAHRNWRPSCTMMMLPPRAMRRYAKEAIKVMLQAGRGARV